MDTIDPNSTSNTIQKKPRKKRKNKKDLQAEANYKIERRTTVRKLLSQYINDFLDVNDLESIKHSNTPEKQAKYIESSIYNWTCENSDIDVIFKSWENPRFIKIYDTKALNVLANMDPKSDISVSEFMTFVCTNNMKNMNIAYFSDDYTMICPNFWQETKNLEEQKDEQTYGNKKKRSGVWTCRKCKSKNTDFWLTQTRGSDEPSTAKGKCYDCQTCF